MIDAEHASNLGALDDNEWRILALIGQGRLTRHIAGSLSISEETLGDQIEVILGKLGLKSRLDLWMFVIAPSREESVLEVVPSGLEAMLRR